MWWPLPDTKPRPCPRPLAFVNNFTTGSGTSYPENYVLALGRLVTIHFSPCRTRNSHLVKEQERMIRVPEVGHHVARALGAQGARVRLLRDPEERESQIAGGADVPEAVA